MSQSNPLRYILEKQHKEIRQTKIKEKTVPIISRRSCYDAIKLISKTCNLRMLINLCVFYEQVAGICQNINEHSSYTNWSFIEKRRDLAHLKTQLCSEISFVV